MICSEHTRCLSPDRRRQLSPIQHTIKPLRRFNLLQIDMQIISFVVINTSWLLFVRAGPVLKNRNDLVKGEPASPILLEGRQTGPTPTPLSLAEQQAFTPILHHASASYCQPQSIAAWNCGFDCNEASPGFRTIGNGGGPGGFQASPQWYVGYDPRNINPSGANNGRGTIVVSHEGSATTTLVFNGRDTLIPLDASLIPGAPSGARVHDGYFGNFAKDATAVYNAVVSALAAYPNARTIVVTGHSQGAALAAYTGVSLSLRPALRTRNITVSIVAAAMPRTGNADWAAYVARSVPYVRRINNVFDPIPVIPPRSSSYTGLKGELHIQSPSGSWYNCSSEYDNLSSFCSVGATRPFFEEPTVFYLGFTLLTRTRPGTDFRTYHGGPYNGIKMGTRCTPPSTGLSIESTLPLGGTSDLLPTEMNGVDFESDKV